MTHGRLLSHLVGHEGEGSVFSVLHGLGWASGVSAGLATRYKDVCMWSSLYFEMQVPISVPTTLFLHPPTLTIDIIDIHTPLPPTYTPHSQDDMCLFEVTVSLTEQGQPLWQDVAGLVLHYIQLLAQVCGRVCV